MLSLLNGLRQVNAVLSRMALWLAGAGLVAMMLMVAWLVVGRYVFNDTPTWTEPAVLLLMSWFILLGAAVGVRERIHLGFEIGLLAAPPWLRSIMLIVTEALVGAFGLSMAVYGGQLAAGTWSMRTPMIGISQGWDYVPMVLAGGLIVLFSIEKLLALTIGAPRIEAEAAVTPETAGGA